jgi:hypothetical protein
MAGTADSHGAWGSVLASTSFSARGIGTTITSLQVILDTAVGTRVHGNMTQTIAEACRIGMHRSISDSAAPSHQPPALNIVGIRQQTLILAATAIDECLVRPVCQVSRVRAKQWIFRARIDSLLNPERMLSRMSGRAPLRAISVRAGMPVSRGGVPGRRIQVTADRSICGAEWRQQRFQHALQTRGIGNEYLAPAVLA